MSDVISKLVSKLESQLNCSKTSETQLTPIQLRPKLKQLYESKRFADFEFIVGPNEDKIKVHRLILDLNDCKLMAKSIAINNNSITIKNVNKQSFQLLMSYFYLQNELILTDENVEDIHELSKILENCELTNKCIAFKWKPMLAKMKCDLQMHSIQTKADNQIAANSNKRSIIDKWIPIPESETSETPQKRMRSNGDTSVEENDLSVEPHEKCNHNSSSTQVFNDKQNDLVVDLNNGNQLTEERIASMDYDLVNLIRCHNQNQTNVSVWKTVFLNRGLSRSKKNLIATCGGYVLALIDCDIDGNESILGRFESPRKEELRSIAWTQMKLENGNEKYSVLAIGAEDCIYLCKEPNLDEYYEKLNGFKDAVNCVVFHTDNPNLLLSASLDKSVSIWQIGALYREDQLIKAKESAIIYRYDCPFELFSICHIPKYDCLVASGQSSDLLFFKNISSLQPIIGKATVGRRIVSVSGLAYVQNSDYIAIRTSFSDKILIADCKRMLEKIEENKNRQESRKSHDNSKPIAVAFTKVTELNHSKPDNEMAFIYLTQNSGVIACGDHKGRIFLYASSKIVQNQPLNAFKVLEYEAEEEDKPPIILSVSISDDLKYLVSTTNNNLVMIWRQSDEIDQPK